MAGNTLVDWIVAFLLFALIFSVTELVLLLLLGREGFLGFIFSCLFALIATSLLADSLFHSYWYRGLIERE